MSPYSIVHPLYFFLQITQSYRVIKIIPLTLPQNMSFHNVPGQQNRSVTDPQNTTARHDYRSVSQPALQNRSMSHPLKHYRTARLRFCIATCTAEPFYVAPPKTLPHGTIPVLYCMGIRQILSLNAPSALHDSVIFQVASKERGAEQHHCSNDGGGQAIYCRNG